MERYLHPYRNEIESYSKCQKSIIDQGILLWNCIHHTVNLFKTQHPEWLFRRHEDLSIDPVNEYQEIFKLLGLEFTDKVVEQIDFSSGAKNPVEQDPKNQFVRNSKLNVKNWLNRLSADEVAYIKERTGDVAKLFYSEQDWRN